MADTDTSPIEPMEALLVDALPTEGNWQFGYGETVATMLPSGRHRAVVNPDRKNPTYGTLERFVQLTSGEINFDIADKAAAVAQFEAAYVPMALAVDRLDGVSLDMGGWRVNVRLSNTENALRLNVETKGDRVLLDAKVAEISALLTGGI